MTIKQRITVNFALLVAILLLLFSLFVFQTYESYRRSQMQNRLQRRAASARLFMTDRREFLRYNYLTLPEQHEAIFDARNRRLYSSSGPDDFSVTPALLAKARQKETYFMYQSTRWSDEKEGVALAFEEGGKQFVAVVTAYDLAGRQTSRNLLFILTMGNLLSMLVTAVLGFLFARRAMRSFDDLIRQLNSATVNHFSFRLRHGAVPDEAGYLADSFNRLLEQLQRLASSQENFVAYASHEIRTPLTVVKGILETSLAYDQNLTEARQSTEKALARLEGAVELANDLLRLAEVESLKADRLQEDINVVDVVLDTVTYFAEKYPQQLIEVQLTDDFTEKSSTFRLLGNSTLLRTVLVNVVDNACKYSHFQPVEIRLQYKGGWVQVEVLDQGIGIPAGQLTDVFMPMMRAANVGHIRGFGLGLTLARRIVEMHQGGLALSPRPEGGTAAAIRLPTQLL